jgi:hypothetical protein
MGSPMADESGVVQELVRRIAAGDQQALAEAFHDQGHDPTPAVLAFLAMAEHPLALKDQAQATLERLKQMMQKPKWVTNTDARVLVREAEASVETAPATNK